MGAGQQRYKFIDQSHPPERRRRKQALQLASPPSNEVSYKVNALVTALRIDQIGYDLQVFGGFLNLVPKRLGRTQALDDASWAFACAYRSVPASCRAAETLAAYGKALASIRSAIGDPRQMHSSDLLCAVYLVTLCSVSNPNVPNVARLIWWQVWVNGENDPYVNHSAIISIMLPGIIAQGWDDDFEQALLVTTCVPVVSRVRSINGVMRLTDAIDH